MTTETAAEVETSASAKTGPELFSKEYVRELREENKAMRLARDAAEAKLSQADLAHKAELEKVTGQMSQTAQATRIEVAKARLEALAVKEGIVDTETLALLDVNAFVFDEAGKLSNGADVLAKFKEAKPHFFGSGNTSSTAKAPSTSEREAKPVDVSKMSDAEYAAHRLKEVGY